MSFLRKLKLSTNALVNISGCISGGLCFASIYPQIWGIKQYQKFVQHYSTGIPVRVDDDSERIGREVLEEISLTPTAESKVDFFTVLGMDVTSQGSTYTVKGVRIGIPYNFRYKSFNDVDRSKILVNYEAVNWDSEEATTFANSLVFSDKAKRFTIARQIMYAYSLHVYIQSLIAPFCFMIGQWSGYTLYLYYRLGTRTTLFSRFILGGIYGGLWTGIYLLTKDSYRVHCENRADKKAAKLSKEIAEGGVEYYNQVLERNKAVRTLMGEQGRKKYTIYGNEYHPWRSPHAACTARRDHIAKIIQHKYTV